MSSGTIITAITSQSLLMITDKFFDLKLFLNYQPLPVSGYSVDQFTSYISGTTPLILVMTILQLISVLAWTFIRSRSKFDLTLFALPNIFAGLAHVIECISAVAFIATQDSMFSQLASDVSKYRTFGGMINYTILSIAMVASFGFSMVYIGRDKRQVVEKRH